jgi:hypothetical protein
LVIGIPDRFLIYLYYLVVFTYYEKKGLKVAIGWYSSLAFQKIEDFAGEAADGFQSLQEFVFLLRSHDLGF